MATTPFLALRLQLVLLLLSHALQVFSAEFTHDRKRIGPLESVRAEYGCLKKFDVSEKTIIRTQDSQDLGAKFLEESDVGNREDCLSLCCKTPHCNVAVFEEKVRGLYVRQAVKGMGDRMTTQLERCHQNAARRSFRILSLLICLR